MNKFIAFILVLFTFTSCFVSKKKYLALEKEITQLKTDLKDDDHDGVANYLDLEQNTDSIAQVDNKGRTIKLVKIIDMDEDGILDVNDFCPTMKGITSANGCPDRDGDGVYDFLDKCPNAAGLEKDNGCPIVNNGKRKLVMDAGGNLKSIQFKEKTLNLSISKIEIDEYLDYLIKYLTEHPTYSIEISGHTDNTGDSLKNVKLSEKRALKIKDLLLKKGMEKSRISTIGIGSSKPQANNNTEKGRAFNNRVEFYLNFKEE